MGLLKRGSHRGRRPPSTDAAHRSFGKTQIFDLILRIGDARDGRDEATRFIRDAEKQQIPDSIFDHRHDRRAADERRSRKNASPPESDEYASKPIDPEITA